MFTGIITAVGKISHAQPLEKGLRLTIEAPGLKLADVALGDSIAHGGVCLTVIAKKKRSYQVDVSRETLDCTVGLDTPGSEVNLEKAMRLSDFIGGHLVSGHVDGVGEVEKFEPIGESHELVIKAPKALAKYIARKGSIVVDGVSLTTNRVKGRRFSINLIPHTVEVTTLKHLKAGSRVNLEIDLIARYVERMLTAGATAA
ncbi:MAG: riboflavin synthase subunit alpha [Rhodocyclales bacterium RIFCSPLOWO2_02_FULL_63_24]|nr:MAG: riboflavin synthase subunit alpha [Rhodocyclales bacterium RIFCSPLOWO2_02_FULL_63_24]